MVTSSIDRNAGNALARATTRGAFVTRRSGTVEPPDAGRGVHHIDEISLSGCSVADETDKPNDHRASRIIAGYMTGISNKGELMELSRSFEP